MVKSEDILKYNSEEHYSKDQFVSALCDITGRIVIIMANEHNYQERTN